MYIIDLLNLVEPLDGPTEEIKMRYQSWKAKNRGNPRV